MPAIPQIIIEVGGVTLYKDRLILIAFGTVMLVSAVAMIRKKTYKGALFANKDRPKLKKIISIVLQALTVGFVTGFVGAGGGFLILPALVLLLGLDMRTAVGTSLAIITVNSLIGFIGEVQTREVINWNLLVPFSGLAIIGIFVGRHVSKSVTPDQLKSAFGYFVLVIGLIMIFV